jgi:hypothetical protein
MLSRFMRIFRHARSKLLATTLLLSTVQAQAHDTWLVGASANAGEARFVLTTGSEFPKLGSANNTARFLRTVVQGDSTVQPMLVETSNEKSVLLKSQMPGAGVFSAIVQTKPNAIELDKPAVLEYFKELGATRAIEKRYNEQKRWRELYSKNAKMLLRTDATASADAWLKPTNLPYEFVPSVDPTRLKAGDTLPVCAYADGKVVPSAYIGIVDATGAASFKRADKKGCVRFKLHQTSGYLIRGVHLVPTDLPDLEWLSHFASLTVFDASISK